MLKLHIDCSLNPICYFRSGFKTSKLGIKTFNLPYETASASTRPSWNQIFLPILMQSSLFLEWNFNVWSDLAPVVSTPTTGRPAEFIERWPYKHFAQQIHPRFRVFHCNECQLVKKILWCNNSLLHRYDCWYFQRRPSLASMCSVSPYTMSPTYLICSLNGIRCHFYAFLNSKCFTKTLKWRKRISRRREKSWVTEGERNESMRDEAQKAGKWQMKAWRGWRIFCKWLASIVVSGFPLLYLFYNPVLHRSNLHFLLWANKYSDYKGP